MFTTLYFRTEGRYYKTSDKSSISSPYCDKRFCSKTLSVKNKYAPPYRNTVATSNRSPALLLRQIVALHCC